MYHLLVYQLADDYLQRREADAGEHLRLLRESHDRGELILGGAVLEPVDQGLYLFTSATVAEAFANNDSYTKLGLVKTWRVRPFMAVVG
jgi:uncharacterized protein YciI